MSFCDQSIDFDEFFKRIDDIATNIARFGSGAVLNLQTTIEQLALVKRIRTQFEDLQAVIVDQLTITLICKTIEAYQKTEIAEEIGEEAAAFLQIFEDFESQIDAIPDSDDFAVLESQVDSVLNEYEPLIEEKRKMIRDKARELLSVLELIGVPANDIDTALEEVEYEDDPKQYVIDLFNALIDKADARL